MYLTYVVYALCIVLILWGGKFAGLKNTYHDDFSGLDATKSLRGIAAVFIIIHHISQEYAFQNVRELSFFVNAGAFLVSIFFFCSGYGLLKNYKAKADYLNGFLKKRVFKTILITFYVNVVFYAIFNVIEGVRMPLIQWITSFIGITMMNSYAWFPIVLTLLYLAFYFSFKHLKNPNICIFLIFLAVIAQGMLFCFGGHFAWWAGRKNWWINQNGFKYAEWWMQEKTLLFSGEWWVNSSIGFVIGMLFANKEDKIVAWFKKNYWIKLIGAIIASYGFHMLSLLAQRRVGYYGEWSGKGPGILSKIVTYAAQLPEMTFFLIMIFVIMMKFYTINKVTRFFGKYSFDTYLMNLAALCAFRFVIYDRKGPRYSIGNSNLALYVILVFTGTILLGLLQHVVVAKVQKHIK